MKDPRHDDTTWVSGTDAGADLRPGEVVAERFEVREPHREDIFTFDYRAFDQETEQDVLLRVIHEALLPSRAERERYVTELEPVVGIGGSFLPGLVDADQDRGKAFVVEPWPLGACLREVIDRRVVENRRLSSAELLPVVARLQAALDVIPDRFCHGDLRAENVWIDPDRLHLVGAFVVPALPGRYRERALASRPGLLERVAPELAHRGATAATDRYGAAALTWEGLTGSPPSEVSTSLGALEPVLRSFLAPAAEDRPATLAPLIDALAAHAGLPVPNLDTGPFRRAKSRPPARTRHDTVSDFPAARTETAVRADFTEPDLPTTSADATDEHEAMAPPSSTTTAPQRPVRLREARTDGRGTDEARTDEAAAGEAATAGAAAGPAEGLDGASTTKMPHVRPSASRSHGHRAPARRRLATERMGTPFPDDDERTKPRALRPPPHRASPPPASRGVPRASSPDTGRTTMELGDEDLEAARQQAQRPTATKTKPREEETTAEAGEKRAAQATKTPSGQPGKEAGRASNEPSGQAGKQEAQASDGPPAPPVSTPDGVKPIPRPRRPSFFTIADRGADDILFDDSRAEALGLKRQASPQPATGSGSPGSSAPANAPQATTQRAGGRGALERPRPSPNVGAPEGAHATSSDAAASDDAALDADPSARPVPSRRPSPTRGYGLVLASAILGVLIVVGALLLRTLLRDGNPPQGPAPAEPGAAASDP